MNSGLQNGDNRFLELVNENRPRIQKICRVYAWNQADRDDLYQEILFQIWRGLPGLKNSAYANTWIYRAALNTSISFVRKHKTRIDRTVHVDDEQMGALSDRQQAVVPESNPQLPALYDAISKLNEIEKALITLFLEELSYEEIAEVMGVAAGNVGVMLHRTKRKLSTLMEARHER